MANTHRIGGHPRHQSLAEYGEWFWAQPLRTANGCWVWPNRKRGHMGYGTETTYLLPGLYAAHRIAFCLWNGWTSIPREFFVMHRCDNPPCVNPYHLVLGTPRQNTQDMIKRGRQYKLNWTHCPKGHEYTQENTKITVGFVRGEWRSRRVCLACQKARSKRQWSRMRVTLSRTLGVPATPASTI